MVETWNNDQQDSRNITAHAWCGGHSTSISALLGVGGKGWGSSFQQGASYTYTLRLV